MSAPEWTIEQWVEHGREWVRAGWVWAPGQLAVRESTGAVYIVTNADVGLLFGVIEVGEDVARVDTLGASFVPYLRDHGTIGHALDQVRVAWGGAPLRVTYDDDGVEIEIERPHQQHENGFGPAWLPIGHGRTDGEALLAARRAAP